MLEADILNAYDRLLLYTSNMAFRVDGKSFRREAERCVLGRQRFRLFQARRDFAMSSNRTSECIV
jgi:hypothetical protein